MSRVPIVAAFACVLTAAGLATADDETESLFEHYPDAGIASRDDTEATAVANAVRAQMPRLRHCYEDALKTDRRGLRCLSLTFDLQSDGSVRKVIVQARPRTPELEQCFSRELSKSHFPPTEAKTVRVLYPIAGGCGE